MIGLSSEDFLKASKSLASLFLPPCSGLEEKKRDSEHTLLMTPERPIRCSIESSSVLLLTATNLAFSRHLSSSVFTKGSGDLAADVPDDFDRVPHRRAEDSRGGAKNQAPNHHLPKPNLPPAKQNDKKQDETRRADQKRTKMNENAQKARREERGATTHTKKPKEGSYGTVEDAQGNQPTNQPTTSWSPLPPQKDVVRVFKRFVEKSKGKKDIEREREREREREKSVKNEVKASASGSALSRSQLNAGGVYSAATGDEAGRFSS